MIKLFVTIFMITGSGGVNIIYEYPYDGPALTVEACDADLESRMPMERERFIDGRSIVMICREK